MNYSLLSWEQSVFYFIYKKDGLWHDGNIATAVDWLQNCLKRGMGLNADRGKGLSIKVENIVLVNPNQSEFLPEKF